MRVKGITDEDFVNYKVPSMFIATALCSFKCDAESGMRVCQNGILAEQPTHDIDDQLICDRYRNNLITKAIVFGGLEPLDQRDELLRLIECFRANGVRDDIVIYTGYDAREVEDFTDKLWRYNPVIVKYGRYIPGQEPHLDPLLGVRLASDNQYAERVK